jgi:hypothetical protein
MVGREKRLQVHPGAARGHALDVAENFHHPVGRSDFIPDAPVLEIAMADEPDRIKRRTFEDNNRLHERPRSR